MHKNNLESFKISSWFEEEILIVGSEPDLFDLISTWNFENSKSLDAPVGPYQFCTEIFLLKIKNKKFSKK